MRIALIIFCWIFCQSVYACQCQEPTYEEYLSKCEVIFVSRVNEAKIVNENGIPTIKAKFDLASEVFKGDPKKVNGLESPILGTSCDRSIVVGSPYLVCAKENETISLGGCNLTTENPDYYATSVIREFRSSIKK